MDTLLEESNLAFIGTEEDRKTKQAAAELEVNWEGVGQSPGIEIFRVENTRTEEGNPKFGINSWPTNLYGKFYSGDSYIVLQTTQDADSDALLYDIYFWIGQESSQDEYGVAAYKAVELDDLLGDAPVQHREVQHYESETFLQALGGTITYLNGGIDGGFRTIEEGSDEMGLPPRLYLIRKTGRNTRATHVPLTCDSLNQSDAFLLDTEKVIYTWFGEYASPFEKNKAAELAHNLEISRSGHATVEEDVGDNDVFFEFLGGKGDIKEKGCENNHDLPSTQDTKMYILFEEDSFIKVKTVDASQSNLEGDNVCIIDTGYKVFVWVGKGSSMREQSQAMRMVQKIVSAMGRTSTNIVRVLEGQETRVAGFSEAF